MSGVDAAERFRELGLATAAPESQRPGSALGQEEFLEIMLAQVKHQDPFKPVDNAEFFAQMAQFSQVSGLQELQASFADFASRFTANQVLDGAVLVDRDVLVEGGAGAAGGGQPLHGAVDVERPVSRLAVTVHDAAGALVDTVELGPRAAGLVDFEWEATGLFGRDLPAGTYRVRAEGVADGETVALATLVDQRVDSVSLPRDGSGLRLGLASGESVGLDAVRRIR